MWNAFISHASEDKSSVAEPLAHALRQSGLRVWLDSDELKVGDFVRSGIDRGLAGSQFGVVILSPRFLNKEWTRRELDGILALDSDRQRRLLPVWHDLTEEVLARVSPMLAARVAVSTSHGIAHVARELLRAMGHPVEDVPLPSCFDSPESLIAKQINQYRLDTVIGRGGSGIVFRANVRPGEDCALKLFLPLRPGFAHLIKLFERGFRATQAVCHPNVIRVLDYGTCTLDGRLTAYVVTPVIEGGNLSQWLSMHRGELPPAVAVANQLIDALEACHKTTFIDERGFQVTGVCHGDLKPSNILMAQGNRPVLNDFLQIDVQRLADRQCVWVDNRDAADDDITTADFGTPGYMHPDQERWGIMAPHTDVYSLVVTLSQLLARGGPTPDAVREFIFAEGLSGALAEFRRLALDVIGQNRPTPIQHVRSVVNSMLEEARRSGRHPLLRWLPW